MMNDEKKPKITDGYSDFQLFYEYKYFTVISEDEANDLGERGFEMYSLDGNDIIYNSPTKMFYAVGFKRPVGWKNDNPR